MSAKHTPGPWAVDEPHQVWAEAAGEYVAFTQVEYFETIPQEQVEANARLIAAAPTMYEALKRIVDWDAAGLALTEDHAAQARAAIAKAEGQ